MFDGLCACLSDSVFGPAVDSHDQVYWNAKLQHCGGHNVRCKMDAEHSLGHGLH
jgi:hypothetical protein